MSNAPIFGVLVLLLIILADSLAGWWKGPDR